jgi:ketosteroid isomerase-like protein
MRLTIAALSLLIVLVVGACDQAGNVTAKGDDVETIEAVDNAVAELDESFEAQDAAKIKTLMTPDHVAVTPYYGAPQSVDDQIASLSDLKYAQTNLGEPAVTLLGPGVAMRTLTAKLEGKFKDKPISHKVFITSILTKQDGQWLERFYQVTHLAP